MVKNRKRILLVTNLITRRNPALWYLHSLLKEQFEVHISGSERYTPADPDVNYFVHSKLYFIFKLLKLHYPVICVIYLGVFNKVKMIEKGRIALQKIRLKLTAFEIAYKLPSNIDFIINLDTEAAFLTSTIQELKKIPNAYFIYEFYAEQIIEKKDEYYNYRTSIEKLAIQQCNVIISSANTIMADFLLEKYDIKKPIVVFSVCPPGTFSSEVSLNYPLKFYYHGALFDNRGIDNAILAMKGVDGAILYIRGFGYYETTLRQIVKDNGLERKVVFLDPVSTDELSKVGKDYDIGLTLGRMNVLNCLYGIGFKTFENLSAGLALVLPESFPLKKFNEDFNVGLTYQDATTENLVRIFSYCVAHPEKVIEWKRNARTAYETEYNPGQQKQKLIDTIESLLNP